MSNSQTIHQVALGLAAAMKSGDLKAVLATYEPGATLVAEPGVHVRNEDLIENLKGITTLKPDIQMTAHEVIEAGDLALHISPWTMTATDPETGEQIEQGGMSVAVARRQADGAWLIVIDNPYGAHVAQ